MWAVRRAYSIGNGYFDYVLAMYSNRVAKGRGWWWGEGRWPHIPFHIPFIDGT